MDDPTDEQDQPAERGKHDRERRHAALIAAAINVFAEHGYDAATTREVAERAGCAEGLIHRYFGGKRGLLIAILEGQAENLEESFRGGAPDRDTVVEEIEQVLRWALDMMWEKRGFMRVSISRAAIDPEIGSTITAHLHRERARLIAAKLRRHQQAGRIRDDVDPEAVAEMIVGLTFAFGFADQVMSGLDRECVQQAARTAAAVITRGITQPATPHDVEPNPQGAHH